MGKNSVKVSRCGLNIFKGHSSRAASTSKAVSGLSLCEILERGSWSSVSTCQRFYNKKDIIPTTVANFQKSISMKHKKLTK